MTELMSAVTAFLAQTGLPVYLQDQVPDGADFPYAAYSVTDAPFGQPGALAVTGWYRGERANRQAAGFLDRMASLVPEGGVMLSLPHGKALLHRGEPFRSVATDGDAVGGKAVLEVRCYLAG